VDRRESPQSDTVVLDILLRAIAVLSECQRAEDETPAGPKRWADSQKAQTASL
jgi:hypothetical protein